MLRSFYHSLIITALLCSEFVVGTPTSSPPPPPANVWGSYKDALIEGLTADQITSSGVSTTYDYVIVGGGPAGLTLALRMSEDPEVRVAVVEKGTLSTSHLTFQPGQLATSTFVDPTSPMFPVFVAGIDYEDITMPLQANGYRQHYPQGKMLGGSSARGFSA